MNKKPSARHGHRLACAALALAAFGLASAPATAQDVAPITIVINQSPWFEGFRNIVELYEEETGNTVEIDVNPFAGSLEKQRNSVRADDGLYDILIMNSGWYAEMYHGGFVEPITDIDPTFELDPGIYHYDNTIFFDAETMTDNPETGKLMSMPVNPNIPLLYYREDLYEELGLEVPETWDDLYENAKAIHNPPEIYGIVQRGARGAHSVAYDYYPYIYSYGGSIFQDQGTNDYTVTINSPEGKEALDMYLKLANETGHPNTASQDQGQVIQAMVTGKAGHIITVIAAWPQMDDPNKSIVVDKVNLAIPPHGPGQESAPGLGHWLAGISKNVPAERPTGGGRVLQVVPDAARADRVRQAQRRAGERCSLRGPDQPGARVSLDGGPGRRLAAGGQHLHLPRGCRGDRHPRARAQPGDRR